MWIEIVFLLLLICYGLHVWAFGYWKRKGVFQLKGSFIFGNIKDILFMKRTMQSCFWDIYKEHKEHKLVGIYSFYTPVLVVTDPDVLRQIIVKDFFSFGGPAMDVGMETDAMLELNPFSTMDLETWKERRGIHVTLLTPSKLKPLPELMIKFGYNMIDFIKQSKDGVVKVKDVAELAAIDGVSSFAYGYEPTAFVDPENVFRKHARQTLLSSETSFAINSYYLFPRISKLFSCRMVSKESEIFFVSLCKTMLDFREKNPSGRLDFFEQIAKVNRKQINEGKKGFTDIEIAGHCVTAYLDSFLTTSSSLSYFILDLAENRDVQKKLRELILSVGKEIEDFDYDKVHSLTFLQMAFTESLRLHPSVPVSARRCLTTAKVEGVEIEKGTTIILPYFAFQKDPRYYPDPDKYKPERYLSEETQTKGTLLPFGDGPRMCIGHRYATLLIKTLIIYLLLNFDIYPYADEDKKQGNLFPFSTPDEDTKVIFTPIKN